MAKQVKIGFDKIPVPSTESLEILYDINSGISLKNADGNLLYTREKTAVPKFGDAKNALSTHINNDTGSPIKVIEQFADTSQVSSSLLGVPRSETQLSLFSDISTYGLNESIWEFFISPMPTQPFPWITRSNFTYGPRFYNRLEEIPNEQTLAITAFPTPWTYPFGPRFDDVGSFNEPLFLAYRNFIQLGNELYDFYNTRGFSNFARENFLWSNYAAVLTQEDDVFYNDSEFTIEKIFAEIEKWTLAWMKLRDSQLVDPLGNKISFPEGYDATTTRPGYSSQSMYYAELVSKKVFRYQPGRISGFTFGIRASTDPGSLQNIIEWGCANDSDEYMFQIRGSQFNIVRRSVIPLPEANLERMGLTVDDQVLVPPLNPWKGAAVQGVGGDEADAVELWETVIGRGQFNGDALDGNGPSGYIISFEQVTMYKIEFSWYGAIGAKFYAYIPSGNGDARWVLIHTIIIENELGRPCLKDPFFKFKYVLALTDTSNLTFPQYIYKYGASYYIDGGDEGTVTNHSYTSDVVNSSPTNSRSLLGITAKNEIFNKDGIPNKNRKDIIPTKMTVSASKAAKIDIIECKGCPGHSYHYAPSLRNGSRNIIGTLSISEAGTRVAFGPDDDELNFVDYIYNDGDLYTKVIADGLYSTYLYNLNGSIGIARRSAVSAINNDPSKQNTFATTEFVRLAAGNLIPVKGEIFQNVRLSRFDDIVASTVPLVKNNIKVNFLNPFNRDGAHFADFFIGVTNKEPAIDLLSEDLLFDNAPLELENLLFVEYAPWSANKDFNGYDINEWDPRIGNVFETDPRLAVPPGVDSGRCSNASINVDNVEFDAAYTNVNPVTTASGNFLTFTSSIITAFDGLEGGELAVFSTSTGQIQGLGVFFASNNVVEYRDPQTQEIKYYIDLTGGLTTTAQIKFYVKSVTITGRYVRRSRVFPWQVFPLYVVIGMRDFAQINNVTLEEFDEISKFSHTPTWLKSADCNIETINSGIPVEGINSQTGLYQAGGFSNSGNPSTNFVSVNRLDSAQVDSQLQQPLRPGEIRSSFYIGDNETLEVDLTHVFGQDRYVITPGELNANATFFNTKSIAENSEVQISINTKEQ
jgi:hypothetical protein